PLDGAPGPKVGKKKAPRWTEAEARAFLDATENDSLHPLWTLLLTTGLRISEALGLQWSHLSGSALQIHQQLVEGSRRAQDREQPPYPSPLLSDDGRSRRDAAALDARGTVDLSHRAGRAHVSAECESVLESGRQRRSPPVHQTPRHSAHVRDYRDRSRNPAKRGGRVHRGHGCHDAERLLGRAP